MIPSSLTLRADQIAKVKAWARTIPNIGAMAEEDASMMSPIHFEVTSSGLGDVIKAVCGSHWCQLTIDDDGNLID